MIALPEDGLAAKWEGRVWLNPPYGAHAALWLHKMANHGDGIALLFARTETRMFHDEVWPHAGGILFLDGRLTFCDTNGHPGIYNGGAPSCLVAYGRRCTELLWRAAGTLGGALVGSAYCISAVDADSKSPSLLPASASPE